jgi:hypothetical protein
MMERWPKALGGDQPPGRRPVSSNSSVCRKRHKFSLAGFYTGKVREQNIVSTARLGGRAPRGAIVWSMYGLQQKTQVNPQISSMPRKAISQQLRAPRQLTATHLIMASIPCARSATRISTCSHVVFHYSGKHLPNLLGWRDSGS